MNSASKNNNRTTLNCELLEARTNPSGNVTAVMTAAGNLRLTGDNSSNQFVVQENSAGGFMVSGQNGTTINGLAAINFGRIHPQSVVINDMGGNNTIAVVGVRVPAGLRVVTGAGRDSINLLNVGANNVSINLGAGNDQLTTTGVVAFAGADLQGGTEFNVWVDNSLVAGIYQTHGGWSVIV